MSVTALTIASTPAAEPTPRTDVTTAETATGVTVQKVEGEALLAGKFKTAADLEKGYKELEAKLGEKATPAPTPTPTPTPEPTPSTDGTAFAAAVGAAATKIAGTPEALKQTLDWARANASDGDKAMFDAALGSGDVGLVELAFKSIRGSYVAAMGEQGVRVTGEQQPVTSGVAPYASREEMLAVIRSPAYKKGDPRVHAEHARRLQTTKFGVNNGGI